MEINAKSREAIIAELPWMKRYLVAGIESFRVSLVDLDTLSLSPSGAWYEFARESKLPEVKRSQTWQEEYQCWVPSDIIFLLDAEGKQIGRVGKTEKVTVVWKIPFQRFFLLPKCVEEVFEDERSETIEEAINRLPESRYTRYILRIINRKGIELHKVPRRVPYLDTWLNEKVLEARKALRDTLDEVGVPN